MGFPGILFVLFLALKLMNYIDWSWWLVFAPLIVQFLLTFITVLLGVRAARKAFERRFRR